MTHVERINLPNTSKASWLSHFYTAFITTSLVLRCVLQMCKFDSHGKLNFLSILQMFWVFGWIGGWGSQVVNDHL